MATWSEINNAIRACRRGQNPVACLTSLFERTSDGHVAMALGEECERLGRKAEARHWYVEAIRRYPRLEYKTRAQAALRRVGEGVKDSLEPTAVEVSHSISSSVVNATMSAPPGIDHFAGRRSRTDIHDLHPCSAPRTPRQSDRTTDATDNGLLEFQYYGCCVVDLYNQRRRHSTLGQISPAAFERQAAA